MTNIHHLLCGEMGAFPQDVNSKAINHCLLLIEDRNLVLIDTGLGLLEMQKMEERLGEIAQAYGFVPNESLTALRQIEALGYQAQDVKHIVISHLDVDHVGGLRDFPQAQVHLAQEELEALQNGNPRYLPNQFEHQPHFQPVEPSTETWEGFEKRKLDLGLSAEVSLIPLFGHTQGHSGILIERAGEKTLFHVADTYYRRFEVEQDPSPIEEIIARAADDNEARKKSLTKVRALIQKEKDNLEIICYHDVQDFPYSRVLFVLTSNTQMGDTSQKTGYYFNELTHPYYALMDRGYEIDLISPQGIAIEPDGYDLDDPLNQRFDQDAYAQSKLKNIRKPEAIDVADYQAIFFVGGHGTMWDFPENETLAKLSAQIYEKGGIVSAVCHGPAALINVKLDNGEYLVKGKKVISYTNEEEELNQNTELMPFLLEDELKKRGALFQASQPKQAHVEVDERLITGQNPASGQLIGETLAKELLKLARP